MNDFLREKQTIQYNNNKIKYKRILYSIVHNNHIESRKKHSIIESKFQTLTILHKIVLLLLYYYCLLPKYPPIILPTILYFR